MTGSGVGGLRVFVSRRARDLSVGLVLGVVSGILATPQAQAVPVFARKYQTSCQTCHIAFPKLTAFGEAFRRSGYRFPAGEDEDATVEEPIALGREAHKKVWPNAVWPGVIPRTGFMSTQMGSTLVLTPEQETELSFANMGANVGLNFAGTFSDVFSAWAGAVVRANTSGGFDVELERVFTVIKPFDDPIVNVRIGRFEPQLMTFTIHRTFGFGPWILLTNIGDNELTFDPVQLGIEVSGVPFGRFNYVVGVVEGAGNELNSPKDVYARVAYKLGGMRLDGVGGATEPEPWRDTSVQLGAFGYYGQAKIGDPAVATQRDRFYVVGGDVNASWRDLNIIVAFSIGENRRPLLATPRDGVSTWQLFAQADYVVFPWLIPTARYERRSIGGSESDRISGGIYTLIQANIRAQVLVNVESTDGNYAFNQARLGLTLAF